MAQYTAGELKNFYYVAESSYGVTPATALSWAGNTVSITPSVNPKVNFLQLPGSRCFGAVTRGTFEGGFTVKAYTRALSGGIDWTTFWAVYGCGAAGALADHLSSFTAQTGVTQGGTTYYHIWNGCKIDKLIIESEAPGMPIIFDGAIKCQYCTPSTSKTITGLQGITIGADPTDIATAVNTWNGVSQINLGGGGLVNWYPVKWKLTVDNHLDPAPGNKVGADTNKYSLAVGMNEGTRDILFECTIICENETYVNAKLAGTAITAITIPIGAKTITLSNGEFEANDIPERKQDLMEENIKSRFKTLTIA